MAAKLHNGLYKCIDAYNGDKWYSEHCSEMKKLAEKYVDDCEGDCILIYYVYDYIQHKYRRMTDKEVKEAKFPR